MIIDNFKVVETEISTDVMRVNPVVTVMMLVYNQEDYIHQAIEGVVNQQTNFPVEIIIGEDCSTDRSREIALAYQKKYPDKIRVVYSDKNLGVFDNGNRCFQKARGEFFAWCEGDDYWHNPRKLQKQVDFLRENPGCGMVHSEYDRLVYQLGSWRRIKYWNRKSVGVIPTGEIFPDLMNNMFIRPCTMMCRTELLRFHFNNPALRSKKYRVGDRPLVLHMSTLAQIGYIDESLSTYRRVKGSMTNTGYHARLRDCAIRLNMLLTINEIFGGGIEIEKGVRRQCNRLLIKSAFTAYNRPEFENALKWASLHDKNILNRRLTLLMTIIIKYKFLNHITLLAWKLIRETRLYLLSFSR